ncbi:hypothetical protein GYB22_03535 [bacterium]|nr:hypothetical protein [bacterium]
MSNEITLTEAETMTHAYQNDSRFTGLTKAVLMEKADILEIFQNTNVEGLRIYFALDSNDKLTVVTLGTDSNNEDVTSKIMNNGAMCPPSCDNNSPLM